MLTVPGLGGGKQRERVQATATGLRTDSTTRELFLSLDTSLRGLDRPFEFDLTSRLGVVERLDSTHSGRSKRAANGQ